MSYLANIFESRGLVPREKIAELQAQADERGLDVIEVMLATRVLDEATITRTLADEAGIPFVATLNAETIPGIIVEQVPINFARQHGLLPTSFDGEGHLVVAVSNPFETTALDELRALFKVPTRAVAATLESINDAINRVYERKDETALADTDKGSDGDELQDLIDMTDEAPVIRWVNNLFYSAVRDRASDIHIEPTDNEVVVRYRIDGNLFPKKTAHRGFLPSIVARVKIEAGLNIAEKRLPQDGRITKKIAGKLVDVRVSTVPTAKGERIVMRLLDKQQVQLNLADLGFAKDNLRGMEAVISRPNGIVLVTGPTGSGKTTTLYACLNKINTPDLNILTVEDPVEYELRGVGQVQVAPKIGLTFASGLRAFLRQDPDVIMVGEIRDHETAEIAIHASLTGHLVLSTLHTNDAAGAITRMLDMGIQPFLIASSLQAVLAQRLVRCLCRHCREAYTPSVADLRSLEIEGDAASMTFYRATGCDECSGTGYRGRVGIHEYLPIDEAIRREILKSADSGTIQRVAQSRGMTLLREDGTRKVIAGVTSVEEVLAATQAGEVE